MLMITVLLTDRLLLQKQAIGVFIYSQKTNSCLTQADLIIQVTLIRNQLFDHHNMKKLSPVTRYEMSGYLLQCLPRLFFSTFFFSF